jgi:hypothetical protein
MAIAREVEKIEKKSIITMHDTQQCLLKWFMKNTKFFNAMDNYKLENARFFN